MYEKTGFPSGASGKELTCQCRRHKKCGFDPWVGRAWQPTPVCLPGKSLWTEEPGELQSRGSKELDTTKRFSPLTQDCIGMVK